jgi:hypothetical protein
VQGRYSYTGSPERIGASPVRCKRFAGVERVQFRQGDLTKQGATAGGAIEPGVVEHDGNPVSRESHVELDCIRRLLQGQAKGRDGVLRGGAGGASVRDDRPGIQIEERVHSLIY